MIGFLRGTVAYLLSDICLLDVNGVGYRVYIAGNTHQQLHLGEEATLFTHTAVREDAIQLYGFYSQEEYDLFQLLLTVSGIGPKVALGIIGAITPAKLCQAIHKKQASVLTKLPGIGKKSAERMIVELKDKLHFADAGEVETLEDFFGMPDIGEGVVAEAAAALQSLGYNPQQLAPVLEKCTKLKADQDVQAVIKFALKELSGR